MVAGKSAMQCVIWARPLSGALSTKAMRISRAFSTNDSSSTNEFLSRGDFIGVQPQNAKAERSTNPEVVITRLHQQMIRNFRVNGGIFLNNVLTPIETKDPEMISVLKRSPHRYIPLLISMCGNVMSDVTNEARSLVLERLWTALHDNGLQMDVASLNSRLLVCLENEFEFDAWQMLKETELNLKLSPDARTFDVLIRRLALEGDVDAIKAMVYEMGKHGVAIDSFVNSSLVYCFALRGNYDKADSLAQQSSQKYGAVIMPDVNSASIRAAATRGDIDRLTKVLRRSVVLREGMAGSKKRYVLNMPYENVFDSIWVLSKRSVDGEGREHENICSQMLEHTSRRTGFFKYLYREVERHICHSHYYSAAMLLEEVKRVRDCLANQDRTLFLKQLMARFGNQMVVKQASASKMKQIANRITAGLGISVRFPDVMLYSTLTCRHMTPEMKFEYLSELIDIVDNSRQRIHIILPLIVSCETLEDRLKMIFRCASIGYKDISQLDIRMLSRLLFNPMFEHYGPKQKGDIATLDCISKVLKSYSITPQVTWKMVMNWWKLKLGAGPGYYVAADEKAMHSWLKSQYETLFGERKLVSHHDSEISLQRFMAFVDREDAEKVHLYVSLHGFPEEADMKTLVPRLLELYLQGQDWPSLKTLLNILSSSSERSAPITNHHLMKILRRHVADKGNIPASIEFAYELRRLFPEAIFHKENFYNSVVAAQSLFAACLEATTLQTQRIAHSMDLLRTVIKLDLFELQREETISDFFVLMVLRRINWNEALNTWMKFQSSLDCSNGMVRLLKYAYRGHNYAGIQFVLHKANTFMTPARANAVHAATLVSINMMEHAEQIFKAGIPSYEAMCAFRLINALNFKRPDGEFNLNFSRMCLQLTDLAKNDSTCQAFHAEWLKTCESQRLGEMALQLYTLFKSHGQLLNLEQMQRVRKLVEEHDNFSRKWVYLPDGLLNVNKTDEFRQFELQKAQFDEDLEKDISQPEENILVIESSQSVEKELSHETLQNQATADEQNPILHSGNS